MSERPDHPICLRIAEARRSRGIKARDLAVALNTHAAMVSRWEHHIVPSVEVLTHVALLTGVSVEWLATGVGRGPSPIASTPAA